MLSQIHGNGANEFILKMSDVFLNFAPSAGILKWAISIIHVTYVKSVDFSNIFINAV